MKSQITDEYIFLYAYNWQNIKMPIIWYVNAWNEINKQIITTKTLHKIIKWQELPSARKWWKKRQRSEISKQDKT
jgi:hypothetical protein